MVTAHSSWCHFIFKKSLQRDQINLHCIPDHAVLPKSFISDLWIRVQAGLTEKHPGRRNLGVVLRTPLSDTQAEDELRGWTSKEKP